MGRKRHDDEPSTILHTAGGRIFLDVTPAMLHPFLRRKLPDGLQLVETVA